MTYGNLKNLVRALLIGDNTLTKNNDEILVLLEYAFDKTANETDALKLFITDVPENQILRQGPGRQFVRKPALPIADDEELDIDNELCFVVARFIASFVSREKVAVHVAEAQNLIRFYNAKVTTYFETLEQYGELEEYQEFDQFAKTLYP
ncbi:MAG: hypothetical protein KAH01_03955 [Caldisericia bacterium]|nr:hypothetical protein [Caldisericia bacterium]